MITEFYYLTLYKYSLFIYIQLRLFCQQGNQAADVEEAQKPQFHCVTFENCN